MADKILRQENDQFVHTDLVAFTENVGLGYNISSITDQIPSGTVPFTLTVGGADGISIPMGTTAERPDIPSTPVPVLRFNTDTQELEGYNPIELAWLSLTDDADLSALSAQVVQNALDIIELSGGSGNPYAIEKVSTAMIGGDKTGDARGVDAIDLQNVRSNVGDVASGEKSVAVGSQNTASNTSTVAMGKANTADGLRTIAVGSANTASVDDAVAMGRTNTANGSVAVAVGADSSAIGTGTTAVGSGSNATQNNATAIGSACNSNGLRSVTMGRINTAGGSDSTAVGKDNTATQDNATAIGSENDATALRAVAVGRLNTATQNDAVAIGKGNTASASKATAIGTDVTNTTANSFEFGTSATNKVGLKSDGTLQLTNADNRVVIGNCGYKTFISNYNAIGDGAFNNISLSSNAVGDYAHNDGGDNSNAMGTGAYNNSDNSNAIGNGVYNNTSDSSNAIGYGANNNISDHSNAIGSGAYNYNSASSIIIGKNGWNYHSDSSNAIGDGANINRSPSSNAIGNGATVGRVLISDGYFTNFTRSLGTTVTAINQNGHGFTTGDLITVTGLTPSDFNESSVAVTVLSTSSFTYPSVGGNGTATSGTGNVTKIAPNATAIGTAVVNDTPDSFEFGTSATNKVALKSDGNLKLTNADSRVAIGGNFGYTATIGSSSTVIGQNNVRGSSGVYTSSLGNNSVVIGVGNLDCNGGYKAFASFGTSSIVIGHHNGTANGPNGTTVGDRNTFMGSNINYYTTAGSDNIGIGTNVQTAFCSDSVAIGTGATVNEDSSIAIGLGATADDNNSVAIGVGARTTDFISTAIGYGVVNTTANSFEFGTSATNKVALKSTGSVVFPPNTGGTTLADLENQGFSFAVDASGNLVITSKDSGGTMHSTTINLI